MGKPKRPTFVHWLRVGGHITGQQVLELGGEWRRVQREAAKAKNFTTTPISWNQFVASKYPHKVQAYQAYLRVTGAAPTLKKD